MGEVITEKTCAQPKMQYAMLVRRKDILNHNVKAIAGNVTSKNEGENSDVAFLNRSNSHNRRNHEAPGSNRAEEAHKNRLCSRSKVFGSLGELCVNLSHKETNIN